MVHAVEGHGIARRVAEPCGVREKVSLVGHDPPSASDAGLGCLASAGQDAASAIAAATAAAWNRMA